eukprot:CAMPEP_0115495674 /NCGR_PEP_ID=MMETSP0271-20121206/65375_1 /TAXON_ID=71861 /ORGANISM="Scrippsiella trochoidea, Strain CCMP3099" /LENGTH=96 /DNA_ID=CAMNT_0002924327 /DNA_START=502 /DNA_END=792 /DNA_ORIENTATION=-
MIEVPATIIPHRSLNFRRQVTDVRHQLLHIFRRINIPLRHRLIQLAHIAGMMLVMVQVHCLAANKVALQRFVWKTELRQHISHHHHPSNLHPEEMS